MTDRPNLSRYDRLAVRLSEIDDADRLARAIVAAARDAEAIDAAQRSITLPPDGEHPGPARASIEA